MTKRKQGQRHGTSCLADDEDNPIQKKHHNLTNHNNHISRGYSFESLAITWINISNGMTNDTNNNNQQRNESNRVLRTKKSTILAMGLKDIVFLDDNN